MSRDPLTNLTELQRNFVEHYIDLGPGYGNPKKAAVLAGYSETSASQEASRLLKSEKVAKAIEHYTRIIVSVEAAKAVRRVGEFAQGYRTVADVDPNTGEVIGTVAIADVKEDNQLKANRDILDRAGIKQEVRQTIDVNQNINHNMGSIADTVASINQILGKHNMGISAVGGPLVALPPPIEVPYEDLTLDELKVEQGVRNEAKVARARQFEDMRAAHKTMEEEEIKREAAKDFALEKEEWDE